MEGLDRPIPELTLRVPDTGPSQQQAMSNHAPSSPQHEEIDLAEINIDNPLQLFDDDYSLEDAINNFTQRHGLEDERAMIRKATYLEQDQEETSETKKHGLSISKKERREITSRDETSFWKQTASLKAAVFAFAALSGICQGMNQSVLNETGT